MWQHHYWGEKRLVQFYTRAEARKQRYKWVTPLLEGKALQQSRGQKTGFCINQHQYWREKRWLLYYSREEAKKTEFLYQCITTSIGGKSAGYSPVLEQRPEKSARNGVAPLLEGKALGTVLYCSRAESRKQDFV